MTYATLPAGSAPFVEYASSLAGPWTNNAFLDCTSLVGGVAPTIDQATFTYQWGQMARATTGFGTVPKLDLIGKFVRVNAGDQDVNGNYDFQWLGYVVSDQEAIPPVIGGVRSSGDQMFQAMGMEWFFTRETMNYAYVTGSQRINRGIGFNVSYDVGRSSGYAARANKDPAGFLFAKDVGIGAVLWDGRSIVEYLLDWHAPTDAFNNFFPIQYALHPDDYNYLTWFKPVMQTEGHSTWQILNSLISPRRGLTWWLEYQKEPQDVMWLRVNSYAVNDIILPSDGVVPGETFPKATGQRTLAVDDATEHPTVYRKADFKYDKVVCRGARRRSVFSVGYNDGTLTDGWAIAQEQQYLAGVSNDPHPTVEDHSSYNGYSPEKQIKHNDALRASVAYENVFSRFLIPNNWDGKAGDGVGAPREWVAPKWDTVDAPDPAANAAFAIGGVRLARSTFLRQGYDYKAPNAPVFNGRAGFGDEFVKPFAYIQVPVSGGASQWRLLDELEVTTEEDGQEYKGYSLSMLRNAAGIKVKPRGGLNHAIALHKWDASAEPSDEPAELSYTTLACTVCAEFDDYCEGYWQPDLTPNPGEVFQTLYIDIGERARFDYIAPNTVLDVRDGHLFKATFSGELQPDVGIVRDDRLLCEAVARVAYEWYAAERSSIGYRKNNLDYDIKIGQFITSVGGGQNVNGLVARIQYDFLNDRQTVNSGFAQMDFTKIV